MRPYRTGSPILVVLAFLSTLTGIEPAIGQQPPVSSWSEIAVDDLHFIRATLRVNHPGPADSLNPWFEDWYGRGFERSRRLAAAADSYAGYYFATQRYMRGFQDGHLGALSQDVLEDDRLSFQWPGIVLGYRNRDFVVAATDIGGPPVGAVLLSCDGRPADQMGREILRAFHGLWSVPGARPALAPYLFIDAGNPFVVRPEKCRFAHGDDRVDVALAWRPVDRTSLRERVRTTRGGGRPGFDVRRFAKGNGTWISLPSFATSRDSVAEGLDRVLATLEEEGGRIRESELVVVDVRGNSGGSTAAGYEVIEALWGPGALIRARPQGVEVDWRVSAGNVRFLRRVNLADIAERYGEDDPLSRQYRELVRGMEAALERGERYYRHEWDDEEEAGQDSTVHGVQAQVYLLTDHACFSACLGFADVVLRLPDVVHVGWETRADAVYIDNRSERLPSDLGRLGFSMKVYRNRIRGHNESHVPDELYHGEISDSAALEEWILELHRDRGH